MGGLRGNWCVLYGVVNACGKLGAVEYLNFLRHWSLLELPTSSGDVYDKKVASITSKSLAIRSRLHDFDGAPAGLDSGLSPSDHSVTHLFDLDDDCGMNVVPDASIPSVSLALSPRPSDASAASI